MTKEQEAGVRAGLAGMAAEWIEDAIALTREMSDDREITVTVTTSIAPRVAAMTAHARELERQNDVNERNQRARDAIYEIAMSTPDSGIVH